ncbi:hypothetical protein LPB144_07500 [Christiangramia salexigens]|uniref:Uncharacterized protein n=1 Tax=Christiangramia salexigens TaxID=1913577 RepID=A0A1L3J569_9FLAO|nr:hypothetical protein LPB144_07500 [Christiangramia salexigens]
MNPYKNEAKSCPITNRTSLPSAVLSLKKVLMANSPYSKRIVMILYRNKKESPSQKTDFQNAL